MKLSSILLTMLVVWSVLLGLEVRKRHSERKAMGKRLSVLTQQMDRLTQEHCTEWMKANGTPERIYFVSFAGDTTWYNREK